MKVNMKILELSALFAMLITIILSSAGFESECKSVEQEVLRLHVIANSDSDEDQNLKLKVRDELLNEWKKDYSSFATKDEAEKAMRKDLALFEKTAKSVIEKNGFDYSVTARVEKSSFPTRTYGSITLPAGEYDALKVIIGEGKGKNWWCVMFPPLCLPAAEESAELEDVLSSEEMELVLQNPKYEMRFWIVEKLRELFGD